MIGDVPENGLIQRHELHGGIPLHGVVRHVHPSDAAIHLACVVASEEQVCCVVPWRRLVAPRRGLKQPVVRSPCQEACGRRANRLSAHAEHPIDVEVGVEEGAI